MQLVPILSKIRFIKVRVSILFFVSLVTNLNTIGSIKLAYLFTIILIVKRWTYLLVL